jgi:2-polyprenyl-6-methoxyphenol hydroxylase-like FAD-dependent oxidoreductase
MQVSTANALRNRSVLISGAGAAGQSLGYWLRRYGFHPTVVERSPAPRTGGYAIDIRGAAVLVAERMGILAACRKTAVRMREIVRLDREGGVVWKTDGNFGAGDGSAGDVEVLRDELTTILQAAVRDGVEYIFGDSITSINQDNDRVSVTFEHSEPRRFDLVIGADGLHSKVRSLAFGPESEFARPLGFYIAIFTIPNFLSMERQWMMCYLPGKMANIMQYGHDKHTRGMFLFASPPLKYDQKDVGQQKALICKAFEGITSWEIPALLKHLRKAPDLYFDDVTQIHMESWSNGRVALVGDAACAPTAVTGQGTSLALVGAYVLAGELKAADGDYRIAFDRYDRALRKFAEQNQHIAVACNELKIPGTWEELKRREERFQALQSASDEEPATDSAAVMMQLAANAISLKSYESS